MRNTKWMRVIMGIAIIAAMGSGFLISNSGAKTVHAESGEVEINETNFPDELFREYVKTFDTDGNGGLSTYELNSVTKIDVPACGITDLKGIEYFGAVRYIYCQDNSITNLDISCNTELWTLYCYNNNLTSLDLSSNTELVILSCHSNNLSNIDVSHNLELVDFYCADTNLSSLDVSNNTKLERLGCQENNLTTLDVSSNIKLEQLSCYDNKLSSLDVSNNVDLKYLTCQNNNLSSLNLKNAVNLKELFCYNNNLSSLDVSSNINLQRLRCEYNKLSSIDVSNNVNLTQLDCYNNELSSLDVRKNTNLQRLWCYNNHLTSLDLSNSAITSLSSNSNITLPLYKCDGGYYIDLAPFSLDKEKLTYIKKGTYNSENGRIELQEALAPGYILKYEYLTGLDDTTTMSVNIEISRIIDFTATVTVNTPANTSTGVNVTWNRLEGADGYQIFRKEQGGSFSQIGTVTGEDTLSYPDTTTVSGNIYVYTVRAYYQLSDGSYVYGSYDNAGKEIRYLIQPTINTLVNASSGIHVSWSKTAGASGYYIFRRVSGGSWQWIGTAEGEDTISYTDTKAAAGTVYAYTVRACYQDGTGKYDYSSYNTTGKGIIRLTQPIVNTPANEATGINVSWSKTAGASGYYIFRRVSGGSWQWIGTATGGSTLAYVDTTAKAGTVYAYTVRAYYKNAAGTIYYSSYDTVGKGGIRLIAPTAKLSAATGKVTVSWTKTAGAQGYYIYRKTGTESWTLVATIKSGSTLSYTDTTAKAGTKYYYAMKAYYGGYTSVWSNIPGVTGK